MSRHTESSLQALIAKRYAAPAYATLLHVRNQTGFQRRVRTADALAMSLYPSRGLDLMGFEIKCDRGDWKRELEDPTKAEEICRFCDRWWIVVADASIVQPGELPSAWGLLVPNDKGLVCKVEAPKRTSEPMTREMLAGLLRNVTETYVPRAGIRDETERKREEGYQLGLKHGRRENDLAPRELARLKATVEKFQRESGLTLQDWDAGKVGKAVALLQRGNGSSFGDFEYIAQQAEEIARLAHEAHAEAARRYAAPAPPAPAREAAARATGADPSPTGGHP